MTEQQVSRILEQLAAQLSTTVERLWGVLIRQAYVEGAYMLLLILAAILFTIALYRHTKNVWDADISEFHEFSILMGWTIAAVGLIGSLFGLQAALTALLNPEYWALQQIIKMLGGG